MERFGGLLEAFGKRTVNIRSFVKAAKGHKSIETCGPMFVLYCKKFDW